MQGSHVLNSGRKTMKAFAAENHLGTHSRNIRVKVRQVSFLGEHEFCYPNTTRKREHVTIKSYLKLSMTIVSVPLQIVDISSKVTQAAYLGQVSASEIVAVRVTSEARNSSVLPRESTEGKPVAVDIGRYLI